MLRPLAVIVALIGYSAPGLSPATKVRYARVLQQEAKKRNFDPATYVSLISHESSWRAGAEGDCDEKGNCKAIGLGQIWAMYIGACRNDPEPNVNPGKTCLQVRESLRNGEYNIKLMAAALSANRKLCKRKTGTARIEQTLAAYGGLGCKARKHKGVRWIVNRRKQLLRRLKRDQRRRKASRSR